MAAALPITRATAPDPAIVYGVGHPITARRSHPSDRSTPVVPARLPVELAREITIISQEAGVSRSQVIAATLRAAASPPRERAELERLRAEQLEGLSEVERAAARAIADPEHRAQFIELRRARHEAAAANAPPSKRARLAKALGCANVSAYEIRRRAREIVGAHSRAVGRGGTVLRAAREQRDALCQLLGISLESSDEQIAAAVEAFLSAPNEQI